MLKQKSFLSFLSNIIGSLLGFISIFFVSRFMGPVAIGALASVTAFAGLFSIFGDFGFGIAHYKKVSEGLDIDKCVGTFLRIRIITTIIMSLFTLIGLYGTYFITGNFPFDIEYLPLFFIVFIGGLIGNLIYVYQYTFAAKVEKAKEISITLSEKFTNSILKIFVASFGLGLMMLAFSNLIGILAGLAVALFLGKNIKVGQYDSNYFKLYTSFAIPSLMIGITQTIYSNLDKVLLSYFSSTEQVGYYSSAQSIVSILFFINIIFLGILFPTYSKLYAQNRISEISILAKKVEKYISILLMPLVFFIFFFADEFRAIALGSNFKESTSIISVLTIGSMFMILNQPYSTQLLATGQTKLTVNIGLFNLLLYFILNILFIPASIFGLNLFGLNGMGAAYAQLITILISTLIYRHYAYKTSKSKSGIELLFFIIVAIIVFSSGKFVFDLFELNKYFIIIFGFVGGSIYLAILFLFKKFRNEELNFYFGMLNPKTMVDYISKEFKT